MNYISHKKQKFIEGEMRCKELAEYLIKMKAPMVVWISEDGSGLNPNVAYDPITNQIVGLVLPTDEKTGMPISYSFSPQSINDIDEMINKNAKSTLIYLILAQPIMDNAPPFVLQAFGTNNKFTSDDIMKRWKHTADQLSRYLFELNSYFAISCREFVSKNESILFRYGIKIAGISSDGDSRLLNCMKHNLNTLCNQLSTDILNNLNREQYTSYIQDPVHLLTKLRNRLNKPSIFLAMGSKCVSISHLKILINKVNKQVHGLVPSDVHPDDRQNVDSALKITEDRVLNALKKYVHESDGTITYLKLCRDVIDAFTDLKLSPTDRVFKIWHALYFFRAWKKWLIRKNVNHQVYENFISENAFTCLELNAFAILHLITKFRNNGQQELFLITLFNSQICESTFRQLRSMTTPNWTKINFSLLEVLHMMSRIELQNEIAFFKLRDYVHFPRIYNRKLKHESPAELPSIDELQHVLKTAQNAALETAAKFGMVVNPEEILSCEVKKRKIQSRVIDNSGEEPREEDDGQSNDEFDDVQNDIETIDCSNFTDYSSKQVTLKENNLVGNSRFIDVLDVDGTVKSISKSAVVWSFLDSTQNVSNDRLIRVQGPKETASRYCYIRKEISNTDKIKVRGSFEILKEIEIGQWCIFKKSDVAHINDIDLYHQNLVLGMILGFKYLTGRTGKEKQYSLNTAPIHTESKKKRGIEVQAIWYKLNEDFSFEKLSKPVFSINIDCFVACLSKVERDEEKNVYSFSGNYVENKKDLFDIIKYYLCNDKDCAEN